MIVKKEDVVLFIYGMNSFSGVKEGIGVVIAKQRVGREWIYWIKNEKTSIITSIEKWQIRSNVTRKRGIKMGKCCLCKMDIDEDEFEDTTQDLCEREDHYGTSSLTENEQLFQEGKMCGYCLEEN